MKTGQLTQEPVECSTESQRKQILKYLQKPGNTLTSLQALHLFGCARLSGRIHELRHDYGYPIASRMITTLSGKRVAEYKLDSQFKMEL